jgi:hypothetical protein
MFEIPDPFAADPAEGGYGGYERTIERNIAVMIPRVTEAGQHKIFLPRRSGESRFGPRQYYYPASRTGTVPDWRNAAA